ncbi:MAG: hypothetical protein NW220_23010 [Leptolyngbyaceae cyanobacterium bins.349]|nr:hypothetical protein [Leptolyngbyaceae cyanobacterium bins.349]
MSRSSLIHWIQQVLETRQVQIKIRVRGNNLYVLCESQPCPDAKVISQRLRQACLATPLDTQLPAGWPEIHRVICYGRAMGQKQPMWSSAIDLMGNALESTPIQSSGSPASSAHQEPVGAANTQAESSDLLRLAHQGDPTAIAHYLSQTLGFLGIGIRAKLDKSATSEAHPQQRLLVLCESGYTPDPALLAEPIAQRLRELALTQFRDAVVFGQVSGEARPEWMVRIDLTPPEDFLREWARWGDVQAMTRLLNRELATHHIALSALLKATTLHLSCTAQGGIVPDQEMVTAAIVPYLQALAPQGIQTALLYGVSHGAPTADPQDYVPGWVYPVDLAAAHSDQVCTTLDLAKQGDTRSLTFLLTRLLNPDLDAALATGGIRVQIRQKGDLLHVLTESPTCPRQDTVVPSVVRRLKSLQISGVTGVRLYGRRSGQKQPLWNYGIDFAPRQRLVPEATPEFAASDAHVDELLSPPGAIVLWSDLPTEGLSASVKRWYAQTLEGVQRSLIRTQLFVPIDNSAGSSSLVPVNETTQAQRQRLKIALLWTAIGALLVLQVDWLLGYWLRVHEPQATLPAPVVSEPAPAPAPPLPDVNLNQKPQADGFNTTPFTQPGTTVVAPAGSTTANTTANTTTDTTDLPASALQAKADTILAQGEDYPTFNSRQLDGQVELYRRYLEINGAPDVLIVGSSRALRGVDPVALEAALAKQGYQGVQVFNFGINGATAQVVDLVVRQMLPQDKLPKLILFADGARAFNSGRIDMTYNGIVASEGYKTMAAGNLPIPSSIVATAPTAQPQAESSPTDNGTAAPINFYQRWNDVLNQRLAALSTTYANRDRLKTQLREHFIALLPKELTSDSVIATSDRLIDTSPAASASGEETAIALDGQSGVDIDGFLPLSVQFNPVTYYQKYARVSGDYDSDYDAFKLKGVQTEAMLALAQYAQERKIPFVFVNLPLTQEYLDPVRKRHEETFQQTMLQLATQNGFFYRNLGNALLTQPRYFSDPSHLNRYGAYAVSQRLAQDVMIPWQVTR